MSSFFLFRDTATPEIYTWASGGSVRCVRDRRADIDYGTAEARTTYGRIGVKVWIFKGEILPEKKQSKRAAAEGSEA